MLVLTEDMSLFLAPRWWLKTGTPVLRYPMPLSDFYGHQAPMLCLDTHAGETLMHIKIKETYPKGKKGRRKIKRKNEVFLFLSHFSKCFDNSLP